MGINSNQLDTIDPIEIPKAKKINNIKNILFIGRLVEKKGIKTSRKLL